MLGLYFKQAWNLLKQEKLFSLIYITGTALSITMVMVLSIILYLKTGNIYPETNRDRMLVVHRGSHTIGEHYMMVDGLSYRTVRACFSDLECAEAVSAVYAGWTSTIVNKPDNNPLSVQIRYVDSDYWKIFPFSFRSGSSFSEEEFTSGVPVVVISESLAKKTFAKTDVTGEYISIEFTPYRVAGVVKDVSFLTSETYADIWCPYTALSFFYENGEKNELLGNMNVYLLAFSSRDRQKLKEEVEENVQKYSGTLPEGSFSLMGQPDLYWQSIFRGETIGVMDFTKFIVLYVFLFLLLLIVPAISLSGMIDSRMERRLAECGVRRTFGASSQVLIRQVISENLFFTLLGGVIGILFSYGIVYLGRDIVLQLNERFVNVPPEGTDIKLTFDMLFNWPIFVAALFFCVVLNLMSALVPAWKASRREIVYSLTNK